MPYTVHAPTPSGLIGRMKRRLNLSVRSTHPRVCQNGKRDIVDAKGHTTTPSILSLWLFIRNYVQQVKLVTLAKYGSDEIDIFFRRQS